MADLKAGKMTGGLIAGIRSSVDKEIEQARASIGGAVGELADEIRNGTKQVVSALRAEAMSVRREFSDIVGNAEQAGDAAVEEAQKLAEEAARPPAGANGGGIP